MGASKILYNYVKTKYYLSCFTQLSTIIIHLNFIKTFPIFCSICTSIENCSNLITPFIAVVEKIFYR